MKQDKAEKIIQRAERKAEKAAQQVQIASQKAEKAAQKEAERIERKAVKQTQRATKKAEKEAAKAGKAAARAEKASRKAEEKRAKIMAAAADAALDATGEGGPPQRGGKKKLLLIALPVIAVVVAAAVFFLLRPKKEEPAPLEPIAPPSEYVFEEVKVPALPVWGDDVLVYASPVETEPELDENGEPVEPSKDAFAVTDYIYENLKNPKSLARAYMGLMTAEDAGFCTVDETYTKIDAPDFDAGTGINSVLLARNAPKPEDGGDGPRMVQTLLLSWEGQTCTVRVDLPEGRVKEPAPPPGSGESEGGITHMIESLRDLPPSALGLEGETMDDYRIYTQDGTAKVDGNPCLRINVYQAGGSSGNNQIVGSYFLSTDGMHLYKFDASTNSVTELDVQDALQ